MAKTKILNLRIDPDLKKQAKILNLRIDPDLKKQAKKLAEKDGRTLSNWVTHLIKQQVEKATEKKSS